MILMRKYEYVYIDTNDMSLLGFNAILELTTSLGLIDDFEIRYVEGISRLEALSRFWEAK